MGWGGRSNWNEGCWEAGEMVQLLRAVAVALPEVLSLVPNTHV